MTTGPGAFRANTPALDVAAMERDLGRIPAVTSARVIVEGDELRELHIVSRPGRSAKLVGRDVQSLLAARWGLDVDHRKVSVVQLEGRDEIEIVEDQPASEPETAPTAAPAPAPAPAPPAPVAETPEGAPATRPLVDSLTVSVTGNAAQVSVTVSSGGRQGSAAATGLPSRSGQRRLAAAATLDALVSLHPELVAFALTDVTTVRLGETEVVVVALTTWSGAAERTVVGATPGGGSSELRAAADAVLRALTTDD